MRDNHSLIRIAFDLTFSLKSGGTREIQIVEFVRQSTMHRITKLDIRKQRNKYVWDSTIAKLQEKINEYNLLDDKESDYSKELYFRNTI